MSRTMRAVVIDAPGDPEVLRLREIPVPVPGPARSSSAWRRSG